MPAWVMPSLTNRMASPDWSKQRVSSNRAFPKVKDRVGSTEAFRLERRRGVGISKDRAVMLPSFWIRVCADRRSAKDRRCELRRQEFHHGQEIQLFHMPGFFVINPHHAGLCAAQHEVMLALLFSAGVGILFGIIPAFKAAILHPIDALRHE